MIDWIRLPPEPLYNVKMETTYLLYCPGLRVSGPIITAYRTNDVWVHALTGFAVEVPATHYAETNGP